MARTRSKKKGIHTTLDNLSFLIGLPWNEFEAKVKERETEVLGVLGDMGFVEGKLYRGMRGGAVQWIYLPSEVGRTSCRINIKELYEWMG